MKKLKFRYDNKTVSIEESSHAATFRKFYDWWKEKDMALTIKGTLASGLRISKEEYFEGTVIRKKNLKITEGLYVITHITPQAMDRGIFNFLDAVDAKVTEPKRPAPRPKSKAAKEAEEELDDTAIEDRDKEAKELDELIADVTSKMAEDNITEKQIEKAMAKIVEKQIAHREKTISGRAPRKNRTIKKDDDEGKKEAEKDEKEEEKAAKEETPKAKESDDNKEEKPKPAKGRGKAKKDDK